MNHSDKVVEINKALHLAQSQMSGAKKDSENPHFKSKYADLASVIDAVRKPFADNGLSFTQIIGVYGFGDGEEKFGLTTRISHTSGEFISGTVPINPAVIERKIQEFGSLISYLKRYALQAMAGLPSEDDDGEASMDRDKPPKGARSGTSQQASNSYTTTNTKSAVQKSLLVSLWDRAKKAGLTQDDWEKIGRSLWYVGVKELKTVSDEQLTKDFIPLLVSLEENRLTREELMEGMA